MDLRCYFITGSGSDDHIVNVAAQAARGGTGVVQIRSKPIEAHDLYVLAENVSRAVGAANPHTKVLIDDRVDVALSLMRRGLHVHGVHLGQTDFPVRAARQLLGPEAIIGLTTGTKELVENANQYADVIDYIGAGPFRPTPTKASGREPIGLEGYPELVHNSRLPIVAIGDIQPEDVSQLSQTGVAGVAMVRAFMEASDPEAVAKQVLQDF